jgi:eukaryotic-like serine/threonine-protein kinase
LINYTGHGGGVDGAIRSVAWSPDGKRIASSAHNDVLVWDASNGHTLTAYHYPGFAGAVAWSPDSKYIVSTGGNESTKGVQIWDSNNGHLLFTYRGHTGGVVAWSPDGKRIASSGDADGTVRVWEAI